MFRLLALLQLTRAALAFTAIADAWAILLLRPPNQPADSYGFVIAQMLVMAVVSVGLYGFGMTLNDLLDARRDRIFAPRRPIPSGRIGPRSAIVTAIVLLMAALLAATALTPMRLANINPLRLRDFIPYSFIFALGTAGLIVFYDAAAKYLGGLGLISLGFIRAFHCLVGNPRTPYLFLSMILLTHVVVISTIAYRLENKRPRLNKGDFLTVILGILIGNGLMLWYTLTRNNWTNEALMMLIGPGIAMLLFAAWTVWLTRRKGLSSRQKGERLMLMGLFWLFVYDATMLASNGQFLASMAISLLLLCAILSFFGIRFLSRMMSGSRMGYRTERAITGASAPSIPAQSPEKAPASIP